jgi:hypothetical protein
MKYLESFDKLFEYALKRCSVTDGDKIDIHQYPNFSASVGALRIPIGAK